MLLLFSLTIQYVFLSFLLLLFNKSFPINLINRAIGVTTPKKIIPIINGEIIEPKNDLITLIGSNNIEGFNLLQKIDNKAVLACLQIIQKLIIDIDNDKINNS